MAANYSTTTTTSTSPSLTYIISPQPVPICIVPPPAPALAFPLFEFHPLYHYPPHYYTPPQPFPADGYNMTTPTASATSLVNDEVVAERKRECKGFKRFLPPRLRRAAKEDTPTPMIKQVWRPTNATAAGSTLPPPVMTTLMIKNIPNQLGRDFMIRFLDGFSKADNVEYDFFYLPIDFKTRLNVGYAFVNLTTNDGAKRMKKILNKYKWGGTYADDGEFISSGKVCEITWAIDQGKEAQIRRFEKSKFKCDEEEFLPVVFDPPRNGSDPNPRPPVTLGRLLPRAH